MKRVLLALLLVGLFALPILAADVKIAWDDPNAASIGVTGYSVYQAPALTGPFSKISGADIVAPTKTYTITGLTPGVYYIGVTAKNVWGESGRSNIISTPTATPTAPTSLIFVLTLNEDGTYTVRLVDASV